MTDESSATSLEPTRLLLLGAGPLPAADSRHAPGVANRLWHFLQPSLAAGHDCLVLTLEDGVERYKAGAAPRPCEREGAAWRQMALPPDDFREPHRLAGLVDGFKPAAVASAGTLLAGAAACELAGEAPVWVDLFGDPLAEVQAKGLVTGETSRDAHLHVWELMLKVLMRGDAFSTVSHRQRDALLGQLLLLGMADSDAAGIDTERHGALGDLIHAIPCAVEKFDGMGEKPVGSARGEMLAARGFPADAQVALCGGGFNAWLDAETMLRGVEGAMEQLPRLHLVTTGGALPGYLSAVYEKFQELADRSKFRGRIKTLGWLPLGEAESWPLLADVALMVDRPCSETRLGARNRLLGLAAARCPVVATRGTEVVEELARAGGLFVCEPGDANALGAAIAQALQPASRAAETAARSLDWCREHYTFRATIGPFLQFVRQATLPSDASTRNGVQPTAAEFVARIIDPAMRRREWAELERYRAGRLSRMRHWLRRRMQGNQ